MNQNALLTTARDLRTLLQKYAQTNPDAARLQGALSNLLDMVLRGELQSPLPWKDVPGDWLFNETELRQYRDLESAYAHFKIEATGGEPPALRLLRARMGGEVQGKPGKS